LLSANKQKNSLADPGAQKRKRLFDLFFSLSALILLLPALLTIACLLLFLQGRPIFYREDRVGRNGDPFSIHKFRTMKAGSHLRSSVAASNDPGITTTGVWLKRLRLDELPQLINVLKGDMSMVGPRPVSQKHLSSLDPQRASALLAIKPGMISPAALLFIAEDDYLSTVSDAEAVYIKILLPAKIQMQLGCQESWSLAGDVLVITDVLWRIWRKQTWTDSGEYLNSLEKFDDLAN